MKFSTIFFLSYFAIVIDRNKNWMLTWFQSPYKTLKRQIIEVNLFLRNEITIFIAWKWAKFRVCLATFFFKLLLTLKWKLILNIMVKFNIHRTKTSLTKAKNHNPCLKKCFKIIYRYESCLSEGLLFWQIGFSIWARYINYII